MHAHTAHLATSWRLQASLCDLTHTCTPTHTRTHMHTDTHTHTRAQTHTRAHTHTHTHTHTRTCTSDAPRSLPEPGSWREGVQGGRTHVLLPHARWQGGRTQSARQLPHAQGGEPIKGRGQEIILQNMQCRGPLESCLLTGGCAHALKLSSRWRVSGSMHVTS
jgi:hypothetical protein